MSSHGKQGFQNEDEAERRKKKLKERDKLRNWDPAWRNQLRVQILGDSNLVVNWLDGKKKINNQKVRMMVQRTQNVLDRTDIRPMGIIWTCFSTSTENGIKRLIVLHMWQEKKVPHGTPR